MTGQGHCWRGEWRPTVTALSTVRLHLWPSVELYNHTKNVWLPYKIPNKLNLAMPKSELSCLAWSSWDLRPKTSDLTKYKSLNCQAYRDGSHYFFVRKNVSRCVCQFYVMVTLLQPLPLVATQVVSIFHLCKHYLPKRTWLMASYETNCLASIRCTHYEPPT